MKATKYLAMAAAALAFAACSSDELASVADRNANGLRPVEFSTVVKNQTRAGQIYNDAEFATIYMKTTGTFYAEDGTKVVDPSLLLTKSGSTWTYKVNGADEASTLYWPLESYDNTFQAWYYDGGAAQGALNNKTADLDAVGAYATHSSTDEGNNVALNFYHAVSKAEFKVKVHEKTAEGVHKVKVDVKAVCLHNVNFKTSGTPAYTLPTSAAQMGAFAVDGTSTRDLVTAIPDAYEPAWVTEESAVTPVGSLLVMPQAIAAVEDFSTTTWSKPYISVLAQVRIDNEGNAAIFPKEAGADDYAWIALPLPADFTQMQAHHKYIFTLNFRNDALGRVDRDQNPNDDDEPSGPDTDDLVPEEDEGNPIVEPAHSGFALDVTVTEVYDFEEGVEVDVNQPPFDPLTTPLTFEAREDGIYIHCEFEYSKNGGDWIKDDGARFTLNKGETVSFRANMSKVDANFFSCYGKCYVYGNVMSLLHAEDYATNYSMSDEAFYRLFEDKDIDIHPEKDLVLPATTLTKRCYYRMFANQDGLTKAPKLPATTLADGCYGSMFQFCEKLTTAPELPATTLVANCYEGMFYYCTSLSSIKCLATSGINENGSTKEWLYSVAATGTFTKASGATWPEGINGIPSGWTTEAE